MNDIEKTARILANPFYCIPKVHSIFTVEHKPLVDEETYIKGAQSMIEEKGSEYFLRHLLENLKGNYIADDNDITGVPAGFTQ